MRNESFYQEFTLMQKPLVRDKRTLRFIMVQKLCITLLIYISGMLLGCAIFLINHFHPHIDPFFMDSLAIGICAGLFLLAFFKIVDGCRKDK